MANTPKKVKDPTEVALSAIQEALNISDTSAPLEQQGPVQADGAASGKSAGASSYDSFDNRPGADRGTLDDIEPPPLAVRRPANDDRETIGQLLQAIQKGRPTRSVYTLATAFAGIWIVGCALITIGFLP